MILLLWNLSWPCSLANWKLLKKPSVLHEKMILYLLRFELSWDSERDRERTKQRRRRAKERGNGIYSHGSSRVDHSWCKYRLQSSHVKRVQLLCLCCLFICYRHSCSASSYLHSYQVIIHFLLFCLVKLNYKVFIKSIITNE